MALALSQRLRGLATGLLPVLALFLLLLASLYMLSDAAQNSERFGRLYVGLLLFNGLLLVFLAVLIGFNVVELIRQVVHREPGSRLTVRLLVIFVGLALVPVSVVYYFSLRFIEHGIDSWFDVRIERSLEDALALSRASLDFRMRNHLREMEGAAQDLGEIEPGLVALTLGERRTELDALELTLLGPNNTVIASSSEQTAALVPSFPAEEVLLQLDRGQSYVRLEPVRETGLRVRVVVPVVQTDPTAGRLLLQGLFPVGDRIGGLAASVEGSFGQYKELVFLRGPLKQGFSLTLSLVLVLSVLFATWLAIYSARRLVSPIRELAQGTKAVAAGDLHRRLPVGNRDELGFLVRSFNEMTSRLADARDEADQSRRQAESQRAYLQAVLEHLSSGVLTLDRRQVLRIANAVAGDILGLPLDHHIGRRLSDICRPDPALTQFYEALLPRLRAAEAGDWQDQVALLQGGGRKVLMCRGAHLPETSALAGGQVIVFDDVTALIQAQRDAAWGEVARRLAHEIKNPLTPIQLSAERLQRKLQRQLEPEEARILERATQTIVQQVEAMKAMVNAFSDYARVPTMQIEPLDLNALIREVSDLYQGTRPRSELELDLADPLPLIEADAGRIRQLLHNVIKNSLEALEGQGGRGRVRLHTACIAEAGCHIVEFSAADNGPGLDPELLPDLFEPYVTSKAKGTGLGLAVVKKIVEEHGGIVWAENGALGGARIVIRLPVARDRVLVQAPGLQEAVS
jgi:nitrogen fixation/metabolism regulation signal transduction histidine kinase